MARLVLALGLILLASVGIVAEDNNNEGVMLRVRGVIQRLLEGD